MRRQPVGRRFHTEFFSLPGQLVRVDAQDAQLLEWLSARLPPARGQTSGVRTFRITSDGGSCTIDERGHPSVFRGSKEAVVERMLERLNELACFTTQALTVHSGLVADRDGRSIWIPAKSGGGKSTLTAQLTLSGLRYATDEAVTVDPDGWLGGWAKWLSIKAGSQKLLANLAPKAGEPVSQDGRWSVPPSIAGEVVNDGLAPGLIVFPQRHPDAPTEVEMISRAEAVATIAPEAFNLQQHGVAGIEALAAAASRASACVRITYGDGWEASKALIDLLASASDTSTVAG